LWIAAAAKPPEEEEIVALESFYREFYKGLIRKLYWIFPNYVDSWDFRPHIEIS